MPPPSPRDERPSLWSLHRRFLRYGALAWGGPVAQIGLMHREVVERDRWVTEERFRKTLALYQALPGPEATELSVFFGTLKRGRIGGLLAGVGFILPGLVLVLAAGLLYTQVLTDRAQWEPLLYGARPAVLALVLAGIIRLSKASITAVHLAVIGVAALWAELLLPTTFVVTLVAAGGLALAYTLARAGMRRRAPDAGSSWALLAVPLFAAPAFVWLFAQCGLLTFGGAYTIIPVLQEGAVEENAWITNDELLDAMAITGVLPTPFVSVGSFVGMQVAGVPGYFIATVLVFAPAFLFTLAGYHVFERLIENARLHEFLLGVTAGVIGLLAASAVPLAQEALVDPVTIALFALGFGLRQFLRVPIPVIVAGSAALGWAAIEAGIV